ncbi:hypothetical protein OB919_16265, partial [Halobacteria archaeon AArc-curdl1]|nr:hypothetical protein [Halobacteria archaeon AArc-curdl1]
LPLDPRLKTRVCARTMYQDAAYVAGQGRRWQPNPGTYLGLAFASLFAPIFQPLLASANLLERWRTVGLSLE